MTTERLETKLQIDAEGGYVCTRCLTSFDISWESLWDDAELDFCPFCGSKVTEVQELGPE